MSATQARLGLVIGGAVIGGFFGVPGLGLAVGGIAGTLLFPGPDPPPALGPRLGDLQVQVSAYGNPIPIIYGTERIAGNIIWNSKIREIANKSSQGGGGKGGAPQQESISFEYRVDLQIALCKGPIVGLRRIWANDQLYYDFSNPPHARGVNGKLYIGDDTQLPDPLIEADKGVGNVSAHRGLAHYIFRDLSLTPFQNGIPTFHFEVIAQGGPAVDVDEILDDPSDGATGRIQIDPDTGFVWASRVLTHKVDVFSCNGGLAKICSIDHQSPFFLSYQPAFTAVQVDILGTVSTAMVQPRMWVGSHFPDGSPDTNLSSYATDGSCRRLDNIEDPLGGSFFCWPGFVFVDQSSINLDGPNFGDGPYLISGVTNGACSFFASYGLGPFGASGGLGQNPNTDNIGVIASLNHVADAVQGDDCFYVIDRDGQLWKGQYAGGAGGFTVDIQVQATASFANLNNSVTYDPEEQTVYTKSNVFGGNIFIKKWSKNLVELWSFEVGIAGDLNFDPRRIRYHKSVGDVWLVGKDTSGFNKAKRINKQEGRVEEEFTINSSRTLEDFQPFPGAPFAVGVFFSAPGGVMKFPLGNSATLDPPTLAFVVGEIVKASDNLTDADIDVSSLVPFTVRGYAIAQRMPVRNALQILMTAYFFDAVESDYKLKFVRRGTAPVVTIPPEDLAARRDESGAVEPVEESRVQENELPNQLDTRFINFNTDYKIGTTTTRRLIGSSEQIRTLDLPIVFTPTEAKLINDVVIHNAWFERTPKSFAVGRKYLRLDPTDVVTITTQDQGTITVRINQISTSLPQLMQIESNEDDSTVYTGFTFPAPEGLQPQPGLLDTPPVVLVIMDIPTLRDIDDNTGVYVAAYALGGPFRYAEVLHSTNATVFGSSAVLPNEAPVGFSDTKLTWEGSFS